MSARGLVPQQVHIPFGVGLNQKMDPRALQVPSLARCLDAAFTEYGGLQTRYPYATIGAEIFGGGTVSECRRIVENGSELLLFTKTGLYSWNAQLSKWVLKGTHLAVKATEETKFATTDDQIDCDRAELNGTVFYAWTGGSVGYVAAQDKLTGMVLMAPTALPGAGVRMRLTALVTKVLLTFHDNIAGTYCYVLDPASPATGLAAASTTVSPTGAGYYDIKKQVGADAAVFASCLTPRTSYRVGTISNAGVVTSSTKARTSSDAIAIACSPTGTHVQIARADGGVDGDYILIAGFVDVFTGQNIDSTVSPGSTPHRITAAYSSTIVGSAYRCHVFWGGLADMSRNTVDTDGALGTAATFKITVDPSSHAFEHEGRVYLWTAFTLESSAFTGGVAPQFSYALQNTYFLFRDDGFLVAKASGAKAGVNSYAWLPSVSEVGSGVFTWCGVNRQIIDLGGAGQTRNGYGARVPCEIAVTFDSNEARRCVRLGQTLYITGGEILQYDGTGLYEVGFHVYPNRMTLAELAAGNLLAGTYAVKQTWRWDNARGEVDRSTTATTGQVVIAAAPGGIEVSAWLNLHLTHKTNRPIAVETWRTVADPPPDAPFYLTTSKDPAALTNPNRYLPNDTSTVNGATFNDELVDSVLTVKETSPENGGLLEPLAPPPASIIHATADRIFLAGVAGDPHRVWYSRQRQDGEVASFHDALTVDVPRAGGDITAISVRDGVLYVWRETACYAMPGDGFDNLGGGQNFGPSRLLSSDVGCVSMEALAQTSTGFVFKSSKGWYALSGARIEYIGDKVSSYDSETVHAVHVLEGQHEIRVLTSGRMLVLNTNVNQWAEWSVSDGVHATLWNGTYHYLAVNGAKAEQATYTGVTYGMDVETAWIPLGQIQGYGRLWEVKILGETRSANYLQVRLYRNWNSTTAFQTKNWALSPATVGGPMQVEHRPSIQEMQAVKIRITAIRIVVEAEVPIVYAPLADVFKLSHLTLEIGLERHLARLPLAQTQ